MDELQIDLKRLGEKAFVSWARVTEPLNYSLRDMVILEESTFEHLWIILSWADEVNYMVNEAWKALHVTMRILKKGNSNTKSLAYTSLVRPFLEYKEACWDPYREGQIKCVRPGAKQSG
jgi:hypothetical protein